MKNMRTRYKNRKTMKTNQFTRMISYYGYYDNDENKDGNTKFWSNQLTLTPRTDVPRVVYAGRDDLRKTKTLGEFERYARGKIENTERPQEMKLGKPWERCPQFWSYSTRAPHTITMSQIRLRTSLNVYNGQIPSLYPYHIFILHTLPSPIVHLQSVSLIWRRHLASSLPVHPA